MLVAAYGTFTTESLGCYLIAHPSSHEWPNYPRPLRQGAWLFPCQSGLIINPSYSCERFIDLQLWFFSTDYKVAKDTSVCSSLWVCCPLPSVIVRRSSSSDNTVLSQLIVLPVLVLLRLWIIWDRNAGFIAWTLFAFVANQCAAVTTIVLVFIQLYGEFASVSHCLSD